MKDNEISLKIVQEVVEDVTGVDSLLIKNRKRENIEARCIYYYLCYVKFSEIFNYPTLESIGKSVSKNHATVLHGVNLFKNLIDTKDEKIYQMYIKCVSKISNKLELINIPKEVTEDNMKNHFLAKHIALSDKYREVINKLHNKLDFYRNNSIVERVSSLDQDSLQELEIKLEAFFKVKGI